MDEDYWAGVEDAEYDDWMASKYEEEKQLKEDWDLIRKHSLGKVFERLDNALEDTDNV